MILTVCNPNKNKGGESKVDDEPNTNLDEMSNCTKETSNDSSEL